LTVVVDANLLVALALDDARGPLVEEKMREWSIAGQTMHAPALMPYEAANAVVRAGVASALTPSSATCGPCSQPCPSRCIRSTTVLR
jgi:predicted nucleic acid-binding protein